MAWRGRCHSLRTSDASRCMNSKRAHDLVQRARGGKLNAGSSGNCNGTPPHVTPALFNGLNKTDIQPARGDGGQAVGRAILPGPGY